MVTIEIDNKMQKKINKKINDKNKFTNPVGRFMVAAGAVVELKKILKRF